MATNVITHMPEEIIEYILEDHSMTFLDIIKFSMTCKHLYLIVKNNNQLWRVKYFQRWPHLKKQYEKDIADLKVLNWLNEIKNSIEIRRNLMHQLSLMSSKHYKKEELSNSELKYLDPLFRPELGAYRLSYHFLFDELISLINRNYTYSNLTHRYYAFIVLRYLRQNYITEKWHKFINLPPKEQILERCATFIAQWSKPKEHISYTYISSLLDDIANQTKDLIYERHPTHSIFSLPPEQFLIWKREIIDDNYWSISETKEIMNALCEVMFHKLGFHGNNDMYYYPNYLFIDKVLELKEGTPIILSIVFESVARRLGLRCEPVNFPSHFFLRWKEKYIPNSENFYIDMLNGGQFLKKEDCSGVGGISHHKFKCPIEKYNSHNSATAVEVAARVVINVSRAARQYNDLNGRTARIRSALELSYMIQPHDAIIFQTLRQFYRRYQMDLPDLPDTEAAENSSLMLTKHENLQSCKSKLEEEIKPKRRSSKVKYAIGLIMIDKYSNNAGVIIGWDIPFESGIREYLIPGFNNYNQPFYNLLFDDGLSQYIPEEFLSLSTKPRRIYHHEIGRHLCYFKKTYYVPNEETCKKYPEDKKALEIIVKTYFG